ncbi:MAG: hypothetical protein NTY38_03765 [Acidobacteria bacterium]|nr:hypothetical protein [Acidobacteriota bacterium]
MIPLNDTAIAAMEAHAAWYVRRFGECRPEWYVFAFGSPLPADPTRPITSFKTAWIKVRQKAGVKGRWHEIRASLPISTSNSPGKVRAIRRHYLHLGSGEVRLIGTGTVMASRRSWDLRTPVLFRLLSGTQIEELAHYWLEVNGSP